MAAGAVPGGRSQGCRQPGPGDIAISAMVWIKPPKPSLARGEPGRNGEPGDQCPGCLPGAISNVAMLPGQGISCLERDTSGYRNTGSSRGQDDHCRGGVTARRLPRGGQLCHRPNGDGLDGAIGG